MECRKPNPLNQEIAPEFQPSVVTVGNAAPALLSPGEREFLCRLAEGLSYVQIAECMDISINTVRSYVRSAYKKLSVNSRTRAVVKFLGSPMNQQMDEQVNS